MIKILKVGTAYLEKNGDILLTGFTFDCENETAKIEDVVAAAIKCLSREDYPFLPEQ